MQPLIIIPARYQSTRFPGKPLALIEDKPMIQHTYQQAVKTGFPVIVASDDERIINTVEAFGGKAVLTASTHPNGTSRCNEAAAIAESKGFSFDIIINVQGDEPFIHPEQIKGLFEAFQAQDIDIATLGKRITTKEELFSPNVVKVVKTTRERALYFSRATIPYCRDAHKDDWLEQHDYFKHIGMYAYRKEVLSDLVLLPEAKLEKAESLEQLRWLEQGYTIAVLETSREAIGIDTPEDLEWILQKKQS